MHHTSARTGQDLAFVTFGSGADSLARLCLSGPWHRGCLPGTPYHNKRAPTYLYLSKVRAARITS